MSITEQSTVDAIGTSQSDGETYLIIYDHLEWNFENHLELLQNKINLYLEFIESKQIFESFPDSTGTKLNIWVKSLYTPSESALAFQVRAQSQLAGYNIGFRITHNPMELTNSG